MSKECMETKRDGVVYECEIGEQQEMKAVSIRTRSAAKDLPKVLGPLFMKIFSYIKELGEYPSGAPFVGYFNMDMDDLDIEVGFPVSKDLPVREDMNMSLIPSGRCAMTMHTGPYTDIHYAYEELMEWMKKEGHEGSGAAYEFYLNDPATTPQEELQTKIMILVK